MGRADSILIRLSSVEVKIAAAVTSHESAPLHQIHTEASLYTSHHFGLGIRSLQIKHIWFASRAAQTCKYRICQEAAEYIALLHLLSQSIC